MCAALAPGGSGVELMLLMLCLRMRLAADCTSTDAEKLTRRLWRWRGAAAGVVEPVVLELPLLPDFDGWARLAFASDACEEGGSCEECGSRA